MLTTKQQNRSTKLANLTVPELEQSKMSVLATFRQRTPAGRIGMPLSGSLIGIAPNLGLGLIVVPLSDIARSSRGLHFQPPR